jgi:hypothetical protein
MLSIAFDPGAFGGCAGGRGARVPGLLWDVVAVGVRALARGAAAARGAIGHAAARALRSVRDDACSVAVVAAAFSETEGSLRLGVVSLEVV